MRPQQQPGEVGWHFWAPSSLGEQAWVTGVVADVCGLLIAVLLRTSLTLRSRHGAAQLLPLSQYEGSAVSCASLVI